MKVISLPTHNRPALLAQTRAAIAAAVGASDWLLCECPDSSPPLGCRLNTFRACRLAVERGASWVLYLEDDILVSRDALTLCSQFAAEPLPGILCLRRWHASQDLAAPALVASAPHGLLGDGFLFPAALWSYLSSWWLRDEPGMGGAMWDWSVSWALARDVVPQWRPLVNRSRNIGVRGTHAASGADLNHFGPAYEGEPVARFTFATSNPPPHPCAPSSTSPSPSPPPTPSTTSQSST